MRYARCISACILRNPSGCGDENAGLHGFSRRQCARKSLGEHAASFAQELIRPHLRGAAEFVRILYGIISPWAHFMPGRAYGVAGFIEGDAGRGIFRRFCPSVDINEGIDIPVFQQFIGREVVMCGVKADILRGEMPKALRPKSSME